MTRDDGTQPVLMSVADLRPLLRLSQRRPVSCAIGMTKQGDGVVLLDRRMKPRRLLAQLRRDAKDKGLGLNVATLRFGRAGVDGASDSKRVTFTVNRPVPGPLHHALLHQLRPAGYQRCEIGIDEGLEDETDDDTDADDRDDDDAAPAEPGPALHVPAEAAALRGVLKGLVEEMVPVIAHEPERKQVLIGLATEGQRSLRDGDIKAAAHSIHDLDSALHPGGTAGE